MAAHEVYVFFDGSSVVAVDDVVAVVDVVDDDVVVVPQIFDSLNQVMIGLKLVLGGSNKINRV
jgi:hypothetical protein